MLDIEIITDRGGAAEAIDRVLPCKKTNCAGLSGVQITLRSSRGLHIDWSEDALFSLLCRECPARAVLARPHQ